MKCIIVNPGLNPVVVDEEINLDFLQDVVGGNIEYFNIFEDEDINIILNDEGKLNRMRFNKFIFDKFGKIVEILVGPIIITRTDDKGSDISLTDEDIKKYTDIFRKDYIIMD